MRSMFAPFGASGTPTFWAVQRRNAITTSDARHELSPREQ
jgi:hypothetical protein